MACVVQLHRSHLRLEAPRMAYAERPSASFGTLPAGQVAVAHSVRCSWLLRQVLSVFALLDQVQAPLALRLLARIGNGTLPVNKAVQNGRNSYAAFAHGFAILRAKAATLSRRLTRR